VRGCGPGRAGRGRGRGETCRPRGITNGGGCWPNRTDPGRAPGLSGWGGHPAAGDQDRGAAGVHVGRGRRVDAGLQARAAAKLA